MTHAMGGKFPSLIEPQPSNLYLSLTAKCDLSCMGCKYGREFMTGEQLSWEQIETVLYDAKTLGLSSIRLYGGEPLVHPDLVRTVELATRLELNPWLTTNGMLLREKIDQLYDRAVCLGN